MAEYDNKLLNGAGVAELSRLVKSAIAQGGGSGDSYEPYNIFLGDMFPFTGVVGARAEASTKEEFLEKLKAGAWVLSKQSIGAVTPAELLGSHAWVSSVWVMTCNNSDGTWTGPTSQSNNLYPYTSYYYAMVGATLFIVTSAGDFAKAIKSLPGYLSIDGNGTMLKDKLATIPQISMATTQAAGIVKPDGITITVDENGVISSQGGGSSLPEYPTAAGNYQLLLAIDSSGNSELSWITLSGVWQYPLQTGNNLAIYQGASIHQYNNNLEIV